jgi:NitT/TauT family transport system ATP-binding protein
MTDQPLVHLRDVAKTYSNGVAAVEGITFDLAEGEFVSLLGPSGCGKSTVLRMIAGLSRPTAGAVYRSWDAALSARSKQQPLSCVFQEPTLMPWATVRENVYLPLRLSGVRQGAARQPLTDALELVGLKNFADARPRQLSGGMKMRASIARAVVTNPRLVLLDEPFAALDEITRQRLNDELRAMWRRRGWTVLFVTHSVFESVYLSTRVLVMSPRPGRIVEEIAIDLPSDRAADVRTQPAYQALCRRASAALERSMASATV